MGWVEKGVGNLGVPKGASSSHFRGLGLQRESAETGMPHLFILGKGQVPVVTGETEVQGLCARSGKKWRVGSHTQA